MNTLGLDDETPIENKMVSRSLESAQKKVEGHNFDTRKQLVEYDDVMNKHREAIYARRRRALAAENLKNEFLDMIRHQAEAMVTAHTNTRTSEVDHPALREALLTMMPLSQEVADKLERAHLSEIVDLVMDEADAIYAAREQQFTPELMRVAERLTYVNALDRLWIEHLEAMDSLRSGIGLRAIGQRDPLVEYKREGFRMFKQLMGLLDAEVATTIFKVSISTQPAAGAPVETALTRAAKLAGTNAPAEGGAAGAVVGAGGEAAGTGSRAERRARERALAGGVSATKNTNKKRKKRR
jgi:preprotein translocase subunit SecA